MPPRRFARFRSDASPGSIEYAQLPNDGLCLSVFLLLSPRSEPERVLLGKLDPTADWQELGGLNSKRAEASKDRWMLPSSHLLIFESPGDAVRRIAREQLEAPALPVGSLTVGSETYGRVQGSKADPHWDIHFVYRATWEGPDTPKARAWRELSFVDVRTLQSGDFARAHGDIVELAGLHLSEPRG